MNIAFADHDTETHWTSHVASNPDGGNILQGKEFIEQKVAAGWKAFYIMIDDRAIAVIEKFVPILGKIWYCPKGPSTVSAEDLAQTVKVLRKFAAESGVFTIKIEPELSHQTDLSDIDIIPTKPIRYNYSTVLIDLSPPLDDIMKNFNQKGRHAIRRAERDGVTVEKVEPTDENCEIMYRLLQETGAGAGFAVRPAAYYKRFYRAYGKNGGLFFAYFEGNVVAGASAMVQGTKSMYKDGASIRERTAYGASHLLQWHVIQWAKKKGSLEHDLAGVPPIAEINNPNHPFAGMAKFKRSFNKEVTQYVGAYEIPVVRWKALAWHHMIEKVVRRLYFKRHHESYY